MSHAIVYLAGRFLPHLDTFFVTMVNHDSVCQHLTTYSCGESLDASFDVLHAGVDAVVLELPNFGTFWHHFSSVWSTWATWVEIMSSNLVEHRKTNLMICHMPRFLKLDHFCPIWARFSSLWSTLSIWDKHVPLILAEHRKTNLMICQMPRFRKLEDFGHIWTFFRHCGQQWQIQSLYDRLCL